MHLVAAQKAKTETESRRVTTNTSIDNQTALGKLGLYKQPRDAGSGNQTEASAKRPK